jgi:hypothetical protein
MHVFSMASNESFPKKATNLYDFSFVFPNPNDGGNGSHRHIEMVHWMGKKGGKKACVILGMFPCRNESCLKNSALGKFLGKSFIRLTFT